MAMEDKCFYSFTQSERRGIALLMIILLIVVLLVAILPLRRPSATNYVAFADSIAEYEQTLLADTANLKQNKVYSIHHSAKHLSPFPFNPNTLPIEGWIKMGFTPKQAKALDNYRKAGATFKTKEDVKKIFFIDEEEYAIIEPYIEIKSISPNMTTVNNNRNVVSKQYSLIIELNTADTTDLKELRGIGSVFAARIVKYRNLLGGFYQKEQLLEVYGMSDELYSKISNHVIVDSAMINTININTASLQQLNHHPYLDYYQAKAITKYRDLGNAFDNVDDLKNITLIDNDTFEKIKPYLSVR